MRAVKALVSLCICPAVSPEPSLLFDTISTEISCVGPNVILSPSYTFAILAMIHIDSSRCDLYCQIGMDKTEITTVSHEVPTVSLQIHYDS